MLEAPFGPCRSLSWGYAALRGRLGPADQGGRWLPPIPYGVSTPIGSRPVGPSQAASREGGPPCAFVPLQRQITRAPHRRDPGHDPTEVEPPDPSDDTSSPGLSCPTTHSSVADPRDGGGSLRHRVPRAGFGYPLRDLHREACRCRSIGASLGFALQGVLLDTTGTPLGARALLTLPQPVVLPEGKSRSGPPSGPCCRAERVLPPVPKGTDRRCLPELFLLRVFSPSVRVIACGHDAGPPILRWVDVSHHLDPRASRNRMDRHGPFPDCLLSRGFAPSDCHSAPFTTPGSGLMVSPPVGRRLMATPARS